MNMMDIRQIRLIANIHRVRIAHDFFFSIIFIIIFITHLQKNQNKLLHTKVSIAHDAVAIGVFFPSHAVAVTWFSFFAHVGNIALRFFSSFILYR